LSVDAVHAIELLNAAGTVTVPQAIGTLRTHASIEAVAAAAIRRLVDADSDDAATSQLIECGGHTVVVEALKVHTNNIMIQELCAREIANVAQLCAVNGAAEPMAPLLDSQVIELLLSLMEKLLSGTV